MIFSANNRSTTAVATVRPGKLTAFRRIQLALAWWGILLIVGGWLHNTNGSSKAWGVSAMLIIWLGLSLLGLAGLYLLQPTALFSGTFFIWAGFILLGLCLTWLIIFPFNNAGRDFVSAGWHVIFALGYLLTGYFMDRRLWWLAGWEAVVALVMLLVVGLTVGPDLDIVYDNLGLTLGLTSGIPLLIAALPIWKQD